MSDVFDLNFLLVDDNPKSVQDDIDEVFNNLKDDGYNPVLTIQETIGDMVETIRKCEIDVVLIDKNIENEGDGIDLVKKIRSEFKHVDILFYSAHEHDIKQLKTLCAYAYIEIVGGKDIAGRLGDLMNKITSRLEDMHYLRGMVISRIIELELDINECVAKYFSQQKNRSFYDFILENRNFSFEGKKLVLQKIVKQYDDEKIQLNKLQDLQRDRNELAHCRAKPGERNKIIRMGSDRSITRADIRAIFNTAECFSQELKKLEERIETSP